MRLTVLGTLRVWHRWFGLLAAVWLTLLAATGTILVFYDEADAALNPAQRRVRGDGPPLPLATVVAAAEARHADTYASLVDLANHPGEATRVFLVPRPGRAGAVEANVFVDPTSGAVLGTRESETLRLDRAHVMDFIYGLHVDLHLGPVGAWLLGLLAVSWLIDQGAAAALALATPGSWSERLLVRRGRGTRRLAFDWHRVAGLWSLPITLILAGSGAYLTWYDYFEQLASRVSTVTPRFAQALPDLPAPMYDMAVGVDGALATASLAGGNAVDMVTVLPRKGVYELRAFDDRDIDSYGRRFITVDGQSGRVLDDRHVTEGTRADVLFAWQYPLHSGKAFGWPGRLLIALSGGAIVLLSMTGVQLWWRKRGRIRSHAARTTR